MAFASNIQNAGSDINATPTFQMSTAHTHNCQQQTDNRSCDYRLKIT